MLLRNNWFLGGFKIGKVQRLQSKLWIMESKRQSSTRTITSAVTGLILQLPPMQTQEQAVNVHTNSFTQRICILQDGCKIFLLDFWKAFDIVFCLKRNMDIKLDLCYLCNVTTLTICLIGNSTIFWQQIVQMHFFWWYSPSSWMEFFFF